MRIGRSCIEQMRWGQNSMDETLTPVEGYYEDVFRIDVNWLAYVCYAHDLACNVAIDGNDNFSNRDLSQHLQKRIDTIRNDESSKDDHILTLSTCTADPNSRLLVVAKLIDGGGADVKS